MNGTKRWFIAPPITEKARQQLSAFDSAPILQQLLFNRGFASNDEARAFLRGETIFNTSPFQMKGMQLAVDRIRLAVSAQEEIAIYGDYDVDGVTATALLVQALEEMGARVRGYIPNRFEDGYGLNNEALDKLKSDGVSLVITVDCGIRSPDEASYARAIGLDLIITDHHQPAETLPHAVAVINPKQEGDTYPDKDLAGVGVAYKIAQALVMADQPDRLSLPGAYLPILLDLVALGTVADLAPLVGENRALVKSGLKAIRSASRLGLFALANVAGLVIAKTTAVNIGFALGPRLNAAGRLDSALRAFNLLMTRDRASAGILAQELDNQNSERQRVTRDIQAKVEEMVLASAPNPNIIFAVHPDFNSGVVGLAASRLVETYYRPAVVGQRSEDTTRCSCRSIPDFHITSALDKCADLLVRHGGHAAAAGFTVRNENLEALQQRLTEHANKELSGRDLRPALSADVETRLSDMNEELIRNLDYLQPTGYGNPDPVFVSRDLQVRSSRTVGADAKHLKLTLSDGKVTYDAIGFRLGTLQRDLPPRVDVMYTFETNEYNGRISLQLNLKDIKPAGAPDQD